MATRADLSQEEFVSLTTLALDRAAHVGAGWSNVGWFIDAERHRGRERQRMQIALSVDMKGISGITSVRELLACCPAYWDVGRTMLTRDVSAAASGCLRVGPAAGVDWFEKAVRRFKRGRDRVGPAAAVAEPRASLDEGLLRANGLVAARAAA